jgi:hypothetical protein
MVDFNNNGNVGWTGGGATGYPTSRQFLNDIHPKFSDLFLKKLEKRGAFKSVVSKDYQKELKDSGTTVNIPVAWDNTPASVFDDTQKLNYELPTTTNVELKMDTMLFKGIEVKDWSVMLSDNMKDREVQSRIADDVAKSFDTAIDSTLQGIMNYVPASNRLPNVALTKDNVQLIISRLYTLLLNKHAFSLLGQEDLIKGTKDRLNDKQVVMEQSANFAKRHSGNCPYLIVNPDVLNIIKQSTDNMLVDSVAGLSIRNGFIGHLLGFDIIVADTLATDGTGKVNILAGVKKAVEYAERLKKPLEKVRDKDYISDYLRATILLGYKVTIPDALAMVNVSGVAIQTM